MFGITSNACLQGRARHPQLGAGGGVRGSSPSIPIGKFLYTKSSSEDECRVPMRIGHASLLNNVYGCDQSQYVHSYMYVYICISCRTSRLGGELAPCALCPENPYVCAQYEVAAHLFVLNTAPHFHHQCLSGPPT